MNFLDEVSITVESGRGGNGCMSFLRRANYARGGPDGGNGGAGGDVYLVGTGSLNTLIDLHFKPIHKAANGQPGGSSNKSGAHGKPLEVKVPFGTTIIDDETLEVIGDITLSNRRICVATGGLPGRGNASFKSSTNRTPRQTTNGTQGTKRLLRLQLKVLADVGLLGMPNAGKTTFLTKVSASRPKIADYPFTTLRPYLGVVRVDTDNSFVVADIPGLIRGASQGQGMGTRFLRHLSRTSLLLHLVEVQPTDNSNPIENLSAIEAELASYSPSLAELPIVTVLTKIDLLTEENRHRITELFREVLPNREVYPISAITNFGIQELINFVAQQIAQHRENIDPNGGHREDRQRADQIAQDVLTQSLDERRNLKPLSD